MSDIVIKTGFNGFVYVWNIKERWSACYSSIDAVKKDFPGELDR